MPITNTCPKCAAVSTITPVGVTDVEIFDLCPACCDAIKEQEKTAPAMRLLPLGGEYARDAQGVPTGAIPLTSERTPTNGQANGQTLFTKFSQPAPLDNDDNDADDDAGEKENRFATATNAVIGEIGETRAGKSLRNYSVGWSLIAASLVLAIIVFSSISKTEKARRNPAQQTTQTAMSADAFTSQQAPPQATYPAYPAYQSAPAVHTPVNALPPPQSNPISYPPPTTQNEYTEEDRDAIAAFMAERLDSDTYYGLKNQLVSAGATNYNAATYLGWVAKGRSGTTALRQRVPVAVIAVLRAGNFPAAREIIGTLDQYDAKMSGAGVYAVAAEAAQGRPYESDLAALRLGSWGTNDDTAKPLEKAIRSLAP